MELTQARIRTPWLKWQFIYKLTKAQKISKEMLDGIYSYVRKAIKEKLLDIPTRKTEANVSDGKNHRLNFIEASLKLRTENKFSEQDLEVELAVNLIGATDTSAMVHAAVLVCVMHCVS